MRYLLALALLVTAAASAVEPPTFTETETGVMFEWRDARVIFRADAWGSNKRCKHGFDVPYGGLPEVHVVGGTYGGGSVGWASISFAKFVGSGSR